MTPFGLQSPLSYQGPDGVLAGKRPISRQERVQTMRAITEVLLSTGAGPRLGVPNWAVVCAAWANAWGESGFDAGAWRKEKDGRTSYGLFQCLVGTPIKKGGAGDGHPPSALCDPRYNTEVIVREALRVATVRRPPPDPEGLTTWWCTHVERPADAPAASLRRIGWLRSWGAV